LRDTPSSCKRIRTTRHTQDKRLRHNFNALYRRAPARGTGNLRISLLRRLVESLGQVPAPCRTLLGAQVVVSAAWIRQRKKEMYEHLKGVLESNMGHWIHKDERWMCSRMTRPIRILVIRLSGATWCSGAARTLLLRRSVRSGS